jgi:hypothetical protein
MPTNLRTTKKQLLKRLESRTELKSFIDKIENLYEWVYINPTDNDNMRYSSTKETVRGNIAAAWEGV